MHDTLNVSAVLAPLQARRFWGDVYFHPESRTFKKKAASPGQDRTFVSVSDPDSNRDI